MADKIVLPEITEIAPEPPPSGPIVWMKDNLFSSIGSTILTVLGFLLAYGAIRGISGFVMDPERKWEAVTTNAKLLMVQAYPSEHLWRIWVALGLVLTLLTLSLAFWRAGGLLAPRKITRGLVGFGAALIVLIVAAGLSLDFALLIIPTGVAWDSAFGAGFQIIVFLVGVALVLAGFGIERALGERAKAETVSSLAVVTAIGALGVIAVWLVRVPVVDPEGGIGDTLIEPLANTTRGPVTILFLVAVAFYFIGTALRRVVSEQLGRRLLILGWILSFPVITLHLSRDPAWKSVGQYLLIGLVFAVAGAAAIWALSRNPGEVSRGLAGLLLVVAVASWVVPGLVIIRLGLLTVAVFALAGPTFGGGDAKSTARYTGGYVGAIAVLVYFMLLSVAGTSISSPQETVFGGFYLTWILATAGIALSFPLGVVLALGRTSTMPIFRLLSTFYIEIIRGVPLITWLLVSVVAFPLLLPPGVSFVRPVLVVLFIAFFSAAYLAENVRGGLQSISRGQTEAGNALGMTTLQRTVFITLPQALRAVIPALVGQVIAIFKDTSLVAIVGLFDLLYIAQAVIPAQSQPFNFLGSLQEDLLAIAVIYWIFTFSFSRLSQRLERKLGVGER